MARRWAVHGLHPKGDVEANARHLLGARMAEFYALAPAVRAGGPPERLHDLRIAAKRLRYTLELFASGFGESGERQVERLKTVQEQLGELRDHDARIALIADELGRVEAEAAARLEAALAGAAEPDIDAIAQATAAATDDPRRGLIALLGRERERRQAGWIAFRTSWEQFDRAAMRADLARLSALPLDHGEARGQDESKPASETTGAAA